MPKIDSFTGCQVMTITEFFAAEDNSNGKEHGTTMSEYFDEVDQSDRDEENKFQDHQYTIKYLIDAINEYNDYDPDCTIAYPTQINKIIAARVSTGFHKSSVLLEVDSVDQNNNSGVLKLNCNSWSGSMWEPPDYELNIEWQYN
jgi:hypothetical protein